MELKLPVWLSLLNHVVLNKGMTIQEIAKDLNVTYSHISKTVHELADRNLLVIKINPHNKRRLMIYPTFEGKTVGRYVSLIKEQCN